MDHEWRCISNGETVDFPASHIRKYRSGYVTNVTHYHCLAGKKKSGSGYLGSDPAMLGSCMIASLGNSEKKTPQKMTRWWFQAFFIFTPIWGRFPFWLIFFKGVETTNQHHKKWAMKKGPPGCYLLYLLGMNNYPSYDGGLFHKPWHKDPY